MYRMISFSCILAALLMITACGDDNPSGPATSSGAVKVTVATNGSSLDADGYTITLDGQTDQPADTSDTITFKDLSEGSHTIALSGTSPNCSVVKDAAQTADITAGDTTTVSFRVHCEEPIQQLPAWWFCIYSHGRWWPCRSYVDMSDAQVAIPPDPIVDPGSTDSDSGDLPPVGLAQPSPSFDGTKLAVRAEGNIWTLNTDGSGNQQLTDGGKDESPSYCPDGSLFFTSRRDGRSQLYWLSEDGESVRIETEQPLYEVSCNPTENPTYEVAVRVGSGARSSIGLVDVDAPKGKRLTILTKNDYFEAEPVWTPNGKSLVIITEQNKGTLNLATISAETGKTQEQSDFEPGYIDEYANPSVSPDGQWIVFTSIRGGKPKTGSAHLQASDYNATRSSRTHNGIVNPTPIGDGGFSFPPLMTFSPRMK